MKADGLSPQSQADRANKEEFDFPIRQRGRVESLKWATQLNIVALLES